MSDQILEFDSLLKVTKSLTAEGRSISELKSFSFKISCFVMPILFIGAALTNFGMQWMREHGRSMICHQQSSYFTPDVLAATCRSKLYTVVSAFEDGANAPELGTDDPEGKELRYYPAYDLLAFFLLLNAVIFYLPELLRLAWGGDHLMRRVKSDIVFGKYDSTDRFATLADYLTRNRVQFRSYILKSSLCELLCIPVLLAQVWMIDTYLGGDFIAYGYQALLRYFAPVGQLKPTFDPMARLFPNMAKCLIKGKQFSNQLRNMHVACNLLMNQANAVIYLVIWWALALQALLLAAAVLRRVYLFARVYLLPCGKGRLLKSHLKKLSTSKSILSIRYLNNICQGSLLDLAVYLTLFAFFDDAAELERFVERIHDAQLAEEKRCKEAKATRAALLVKILETGDNAV